MHSLIGRLLDLSIGYSLIIHPELKLSSLIVHKKQVFLTTSYLHDRLFLFIN